MLQSLSWGHQHPLQHLVVPVKTCDGMWLLWLQVAPSRIAHPINISSVFCHTPGLSEAPLPRMQEASCLWRVYPSWWQLLLTRVSQVSALGAGKKREGRTNRERVRPTMWWFLPRPEKDGAATRVDAMCTHRPDPEGLGLDREQLYWELSQLTHGIALLGPYTLDRNSLYVNGEQPWCGQSRFSLLGQPLSFGLRRHSLWDPSGLGPMHSVC